MMKEKRDNINNQHEDIRRYLNDEMTGSERNAFEKKLELDPFLADAVEGYSLLSGAEAATDIKSLKGKLESRIRGRSTLIYRVAAAVVVLIGISSVLLVRNLRQPSLEMAESREIPVEIKVAEPVTDLSEVGHTIGDTGLPGKQDIEKLPEEKFFPIADESAPEERLQDNPALLNNRVLGILDSVIITDAVMAEVSMKVKEDEEAAPVAGVKARKTALERKAERPDKIEAQAVEAQAVEDGALSGEAVPVTGKEEYKKYLERELVYPAGYESLGEVIVKLKIIIGTDGTVNKIIINESPGREFSDEAERLIREGPAWLPAMRNGVAVLDTLQITVSFR